MSASGAKSPASAANIVFVPRPCWQGCTALQDIASCKPSETRPACAALTGGGRTACAAALFLIFSFCCIPFCALSVIFPTGGGLCVLSVVIVARYCADILIFPSGILCRLAYRIRYICNPMSWNAPRSEECCALLNPCECVYTSIFPVLIY